jgi:hypothetical protein
MRTLYAVMAGFLLFSSEANAGDIRCEGRLVGVGDSVLELQAKCGAPDHLAVRPHLRAAGTRQVLTYVREQIETWTYAGAPGSLGQVITVRRGRVAAVQTIGKLDLRPDPGCSGVSLDTGARTGTVRLRCGRAQDRATWEQERVVRSRDGLDVRRLTVHERWTYNPGKGRLLQILHFANGRLVKQETGHRAP